ncbi:MAG: EamA family transporter [Clostridia bacterium]|nr:EamA family transporter [Clostridia bacterium]
MMVILLTVAMVFFYSWQSLFLKLFSAHYQCEDSSLTSGVFSISYGIFIGFATFLLAGGRFAPSPLTLLLGLLNAVTLLIYNTSMIQAGRTGSYSFQMIAMLFGGIVVPMVFNILFLGDSLSLIHFLAIVVMLVSFVVMNLDGLSLKGNSKKFILWCIALFISNGMYSVFLNLQKVNANGAERNEMIMLTFLGMAVLYAIMLGAKNPKALIQGFKIPRKPLIYLFICCLSATLACHMMVYMLNIMDATILFSVSNGGILVLSVLYSFIIFKEKLSRNQIIGMIMAGTSLLVLSV